MRLGPQAKLKPITIDAELIYNNASYKSNKNCGVAAARALLLAAALHHEVNLTAGHQSASRALVGFE
jgi:hypothetical protein